MIRRLYMKAKQFLLKYFILWRGGTIAYAKYLGVNVGEGCRLYITSFGSEPFLITIGNRVTITAGVKLLTHNGSTWLIRDDKGRRYDYKPIEIKDDVFIGTNSIIMPGVVIDSEVIVAAGSVVTKSIPQGSIVGGNPAKIIGSYKEYKQRALETFVSDQEKNIHRGYKEGIMAFIDKEPKKMMLRKQSTASLTPTSEER